MDNKIFLLVILSMFLISFTSAEIETLGTFKQGSTINLVQTCLNSTSSNITRVVYPDSSFSINSIKQMTESNDNYNYTYNLTSQIGQYIVYGVCNENGTNTLWAYDFYITPSGFQNNLGFYFLIILLSLGLIVIGFYMQDIPIIIFGAMGFVFIGLYVLFYGINGIKDAVYTWGLGIILISVASYILIKASSESLNDN